MSKYMNSKPLVSIVIPMYNAEKYLHECIDSILNQSYENLQIVIVDDGSTDSSRNIVRSYMKKDKRIELIEQENLYAGAARNNGMKYAKGKYIQFLDADDVFENKMVEKMCRRAEETDSDIVVCNSRKYDQQKKRFDILPGALDKWLLPEKEVFSKDDLIDVIFQLTTGWAWDKLFLRKFIEKNDIIFLEIQNTEDQFFTSIAYAEAERISVVNEVLVNHRTNVETSLEYNRFNEWKCSLNMLSCLKKELEKRDVYLYLRKTFNTLAVGYICDCLTTCKDYSVYNMYYNYVKNTSFEDLQISLDEEDYGVSYLYEKAVLLNKCDANEFLIADRNAFYMQKKEDDYWLRVQNAKKKWVFQEDTIKSGSRIVVYGYGEVGQDFCWQIINSKYFELVGVIDKKLKINENDGIKVIRLSELNKEKFDYVIIAIMNQKVAEEVKGSLLSEGCDPDKIVWFALQ